VKSGSHFAHYEIIGPIGRGAMGEVFSARDTRLNREVAVKVLPKDFASDPDRLARFRREAKVLAALNHTNIAAIHGLEEEQDTILLAMELAPGETLEDRISRGPMPIDEALTVAVQIAAGLEEAHSKGIVHRDLKPANVKLSADGQIKILDFGLARAYEGEENPATEPGSTPTLTAAMTQAGVILGTAAYMSPEQARGQEVDARSDIWAFGVLLWELLAGRRLFAGETASDTLAMVLRSDPDWSALPPEIPPSLRRLLQRCLQRDKRQRMHHMADARIVMEEILQDGTSAYEAVDSSIMPMRGGGAGKTRTGWVAAAVLTLVVLVLGWQVINDEPAAAAKPIRFDLSLPSDQWIQGNRLLLAVSPSGDEFVISLKTPSGTQLFLRTMDDPALVPVPGTEDASAPFFSPDGSWLGFTSNRKMRKVSLAGGSPIELCETNWGGGSWSADDRIVFTSSYADGLFVVPASGGSPQQITTTDPDHHELGHWWPQWLPGNEWVIYTGYSTPIENARVMAFCPQSGEYRVLVEGGTFGRWAPTGHLLFVREGKLMAAPFDARKIVVTGSAEPVLDDIYLETSDGFSPLGFGANGTLVYAPDSVINAPNRLAWCDRQEELTALDLPERHYSKPRLSPDGRHIAVSIADNHNTDIWIHDLERGTSSRFTYSPSSDLNPIWTPDGRTVIYNGEEPQYTIYQRPADGSGDTQLLLKKPVDTLPTSVSPDGKWLVYTESAVETNGDIWLLSLDEEGETQLFLQTDFQEGQGVISPDGRWLAYGSNESGQSEIYAMPFPDGGSRVQISIAGGSDPVWSPKGDELYFQQQSEMMVGKIDRERSTANDLVVDRPQPLFGQSGALVWPSETILSPTPDAQRFLITHTPDKSQPRTLRVVVNWFAELAQ
jgi:eukaryotic-like serine/threonine-protein kinase